MRFPALFLLLSSLALGCGPATEVPPSKPGGDAPASCTRGRVFIVVRHAEKASNDKDTPLSEKGAARARVLASMFKNAGVTRVFATPYKRTQETVGPLAAALGLKIDVRPPDKTKELVAELQGMPDGSVIMVASHSNIVPVLVRELGGGAKLRGVAGDVIPEDDFSRVAIIAQACSATTTPLVELSSGDPAP